MKMITVNKKNLLSISLLAIMLAILISPDEYIGSVFAGLIIYVKNVLPALLPFIFFTKILSSLDSATVLSDCLKKPCHRLFHAPAITAYIMLMSILCGYPIGAKLIYDYYNKGLLTSEQAEHITALSSTVGPIFLIGTVGTLLLGDKVYGYIILMAHLTASIITGIITRGINTETVDKAQPILAYRTNILGDSMSDSILSVLCVGGYIAIMSILIQLLDQIMLLDIISGLFEGIGILSAYTKGIITGLIEMTSGVTLLSTIGLSFVVILPSVAFITSFGGICIHLQSMNYLSACGVRYSRFFTVKLLQSVLTALLTLPLTLLLL